MGEPKQEQPEEPSQLSEGEIGAFETAEMTTLPLEEFNQIKKEAAEYKDKYIRQLAEMENMRKRLQKERQEMIQFAVQSAIVDFLTPIDHLENALKYADQASAEIKHWALGFQMILNQFKDVLANSGVVAFQSEGTPFDPHCHEAVEMVATDECPPGIVLTESVKGYKMGGKTIRPARVTVSMPLPKELNNENNNKG